MAFITITADQKKQYNAVVSHPLQSYEWGEFRKKTGVELIRQAFVQDNNISNGFTVTFHRVPKMPFTIGYLPKGDLPTKPLLNELQTLGQSKKAIFIQLEPQVEKHEGFELHAPDLHTAAHPLLTKYTFVLDLTPSEDELLKNMHSKTRYNIRVAQKHGVEIIEDNSNSAFETYIKLTEETTKRQGFYAHTPTYHRIQWETLPHTVDKDTLSSHLLLAKYKNEVLVAWIVFVFKKTLYYPYGASSNQHREVMASNLMMWEAIRFGKRLGLQTFDMWGALGPNPNPQDSWYGFHRFKQGYGGKLTEYIGSYDYVFQPFLYSTYTVADKLRWMYLRLKK